MYVCIWVEKVRFSHTGVSYLFIFVGGKFVYLVFRCLDVPTKYPNRYLASICLSPIEETNSFYIFHWFDSAHSMYL
jgi:hypothetical protein